MLCAQRCGHTDGIPGFPQTPNWNFTLLNQLHSGLVLLAQVGGGADAGAEVPGTPDGPGAPGGFWVQFFANPLNLLLLSAILFIFLVLRPQQKQMREQQARLAGLKKNDRVVTSGGIHGTVVQVSSDEPTVTLRIDENSGARMTVNKDAITAILTPDDKDKSKK